VPPVEDDRDREASRGEVRGSDRPTEPLPPPGPEVWVATWDVGGMRRLSVRLQGRARVVPLRELSTLTLATPSTVVLLDACAPGLDPREAAPLVDGTGATVVVWGASAQLRRQLRGQPGAASWLHVPADTSSQELAEILGGLL